MCPYNYLKLKYCLYRLEQLSAHLWQSLVVSSAWAGDVGEDINMAPELIRLFPVPGSPWYKDAGWKIAKTLLFQHGVS